MRAALAGIGDPAVRSAATATLDRLTTRRDEVAAAAGPDELSAALSELDSEFATLTHTSARRRAGQTYAGRTLCHLDAVRDLDFTFGDAVLARLTPLEPLLQSARWLTAELARAYTDVLAGLYRELAGETGTGPVPLADLWFLAQAALFGATRPADAVVDEYVRRWTALLGLDSVATGTRRLALSAAELRTAAADVFAADRPGWAAARIHSPDLHLCAPDAAALARGEFTVVLGELHIAVSAMDTHFFALGHPDPAELVAAMAHDIPASRIHLGLPAEVPRTSARNADWLLGADDAVLGFAPAVGVDRRRLIPLPALRVEPAGTGLVVRAADGRTWPLIEAFADLLNLYAFDTWKLADGAATRPGSPWTTWCCCGRPGAPPSAPPDWPR